MDFDLLPNYFGHLFDREFAEKLVIEAFEEDTGLKVGSGSAENFEDEDKEGEGKEDKVGEPETETTKEDEGKLGKADDKEDKEEED